MALQSRAQPSQVKAPHNAGLAAIGRDSFAHGVETAGGVITRPRHVWELCFIMRTLLDKCPRDRGIEQKNVHDLVLGDST